MLASSSADGSAAKPTALREITIASDDAEDPEYDPEYVEPPPPLPTLLPAVWLCKYPKP